MNYVTYKFTAFQLQVNVKARRIRQLLLLALLAHASIVTARYRIVCS